MKIERETLKLSPAARRALVRVAKGEPQPETEAGFLAFGELARHRLIELGHTLRRWRASERGRAVLLLLLAFLALVGCGPVDIPEARPNLLGRDPCDVTLYVDECREAGLPSDYGIAWGCRRVVVPGGGPAPALAFCVDQGDYKCCEAKDDDQRACAALS